MQNNFTQEEIKNSVEYLWRKHQIKSLLIAYLIVAPIVLLICFLTVINDLSYIGIALLVWLFELILTGLIFGGLCLFYYLKIRYLLNNYRSFNAYEVTLDTPSTSFMYKGAIYYKVSFVDNELTKVVDTNPYFSDLLFSKFSPSQFNNKKVIGLYDNNKNIFYIIKKLD